MSEIRSSSVHLVGGRREAVVVARWPGEAEGMAAMLGALPGHGLVSHLGRRKEKVREVITTFFGPHSPGQCVLRGGWPHCCQGIAKFRLS